jgi:hypothetical protein
MTDPFAREQYLVDGICGSGLFGGSMARVTDEVLLHIGYDGPARRVSDGADGWCLGGAFHCGSMGARIMAEMAKLDTTGGGPIDLDSVGGGPIG